MIWDLVSTISLEKNKNLVENIKGCKVTMRSNGGDRKIEEQGIWPGVGQAYLDDRAIMNIVSQSKAIK